MAQQRLAGCTALLDAYDAATPAQDEATLAEVRAAGPIVDAIRTLIKDLS